MEGPDKSIEISLKDYGIAWVDLGDVILFYYGIRYGGNGEFVRFDYEYFLKSAKIQEEFKWVDWGEFMEQCPDIFELDLINQIVTLHSYFGHVNIFGSSYFKGFTYEEVINETSIL